MKCSSKKCQIDIHFLIRSIDDGEKLWAFCPNDDLLHAIERLPDSELDTYPSEIQSQNELYCEISEALNLPVDSNDKFFIYKTEERGKIITIHLCGKYLKQLRLHNLEPEAFLVLKNKHGIFHEIHDDFYDEEHGYALQPVEI